MLKRNITCLFTCPDTFVICALLMSVFNSRLIVLERLTHKLKKNQLYSFCSTCVSVTAL